MDKISRMKKVGPDTSTSSARGVEENIELLESLAETVLAAKKKAMSRRPIVIEFCGTPKAGKSSCIGSLTIFLKRNGFNVHVLAERAGVCPIRNKFDPNFNIWTASSALIELSEILSNRPKEFDIIILDRGLFDAACWFTWQLEHAKLDRRHYNIFVEFFFAPYWRSKIDLVYIFTADPNAALKREYATLLTRKQGSVMNDRVISQYNDATDKCVHQNGHLFRKIVRINTSGIEQNEVSFRATDGVLRALDDLISERVGYFDNVGDLDAFPLCFPLREFLATKPKLKFGPRAAVEANPHAIQPIPVGMISDMRLTKVLMAKKSKSGTSEASSEKGRDLFYFGGHVRPEDGDFGLKVTELFSATLHRELKEELDLDFVPDASTAICVWDRSSPKAAKHMAVAMLCKMDFEISDFRTDRKEFSEKALRTISQAEFNMTRLKPEIWSQNLIREFLGWSFI